MAGSNTLFSMFVDTYEKNREKTAYIYKVQDEEFEVSYEKLFDDALVLSRAFKAKGINKGSKVMFVCDNRYAWIVTDMALVSLGAISVPRGSDTPSTELGYIIEHSESDFLILESTALYEMHIDTIKSLKLKAVFVIEADNMHKIFDHTFSYKDLLKNRKIYDNEIEDFIALGDNLYEDDIFTLIYTSGTTGKPKGVILTHTNIMHNVKVIPDLIALTSDDVWVSILPPWHIFERAIEYAIMSQGSSIVYSSIKTFGADLVEYKPTLVATVPRLWESMHSKINNTLEKQDPKKAKIFKKLVAISATYNRILREAKDELPRFKKENFIEEAIRKLVAYTKLLFIYPLNLFAKKKLQAVQEKFGGRLRLAISGGGTLPEFLDEWIDAIGIRIVNAYGMTECAPAIAGRALNCNTFATLGTAVEETELKILNDKGEEVPCGEVGEIVIKGPQVTPGYYKNEEENQKVFIEDGFFVTGDLGKLTIRDELIITGRSKEIIVLANGENVDPSRIESTVAMLPFVEDMILVGHDKKSLAMLIVPDFEKLKEHISENFGKAVDSIDHVLEDKQIVNKIKSDINTLLHPKKGFKPFEKLSSIHFLSEEFKPGEELTNTFKKKRHFIEKKYKELIDKILP